jgi:hypothetical protein
MPFTYVSTYTDPDTGLSATVSAFYDATTGDVEYVRIQNDRDLDLNLHVLQQFSQADPARPANWNDPDGTGVVRFGPVRANRGTVTQATVGALHLKYAFGSPYYGDEYLTSTGQGPLDAGGEVQLVLTR